MTPAPAAWNPLRTLAGRLVLVTVAAIALSHALAFIVFANERSFAIRREAQANVTERIVSTVQRLRDVPESDQWQLARSASDFGVQFTLINEPLQSSGAGPGARIASAVSDELSTTTRARTRIIEIDWPRRWRIHRRFDGLNVEPDQHPEHAGARPQDILLSGPKDSRRTVTEAIIDVELGDGRWLRTRAFLPAPRPAPASMWFAALASMLAVGVGAILVSRQIGRPLADLAAAAERLGAGETGVAAPVTGPDDVRRASTAFNAMAERLSRQFGRQRHMLWALSHDLRTPITALRLRAELIEDDATRQKLLGPLTEIETMAEQALELARAGVSEESRVSVDLAEIARTMCAELNDVGLNVTADANTPIAVACRPDEIARAMRNLCENAAKHGGGGVLKVYRETDSEVIIEAIDNGPGVPEDLLARIAEPFFRADPARSGDGGAGLGLAIVQAIVDGHGGRLEIANRSPHGLSVKLILPG